MVPDYSVDRTFPIFPTGDAFGVGDVIASAELWFYSTYKGDDYARAWSIQIQNGQPTYPHDPVVTGDFDRTHYADDGGSLAKAGITAGAWNHIDLNAAGLTWIQKGAGNKTKLCLRITTDIAGTSPTGPYGLEGIYPRVMYAGYKMYLKITRG
jgi:hypothetical protein